ncbi:molybdopterin oxidoreductase [Sulfobacillus acidophilus TPY]|uniref:Molybdopterin oxidoreductase n=1 Tax=Sulfobacillus acidophilus (strain ATCC 700253 / DSM 10332 / NAL) TaxID=679936 RepID=G8TVN7_SULAD|nr:molybdopterin oxidoreductase [Sulfobacillus acidophilus TPY]AEW03676.1 molybdopterin oxidoreductase [Sulfobacillus acidophilus DSM 10332]
MAQVRLIDIQEQPEENPNLRKIHTTCYMCACRCGIEVTLEGDRIRFISGIPEHPVNKGVWCAKGGAGIMTEYSPARLSQPLMRDPSAPRGEGKLVPVDWETALSTVTGWLKNIRETDPRKLAYFTGRDQMQAFNGYWARQFGTPNWAAHGGFCSVNMAAGGMYSVGGSLWEFGWPDLEKARLFVMFGVAEDHPSNPLKLAISGLKDRGGRFIVVNPVRSGYGALADEWVPIRPGTDGAFILALMHVLIREGLVDEEYVRAWTNGPALVIDAPGTPENGLFYRNEAGEMMVALESGDLVSFLHAQGQGVLEGRFTVDGKTLRPAFTYLQEEVMKATPAWAESITGIPKRTIVRLALEMGKVSREHPVVLPIPWTDFYGRQHSHTIGRPVAFHAMRGLAAHTNGFQTIRGLFDLMMLLGAVDTPGGFLYKSPYPKQVPPPVKPAPNPEDYRPNQPAKAPLLGYPTTPDDMLVVGDEAMRIDEAYSWKYPLAAHGGIQNVIRNAAEGHPYPIDTLMIYMANIAWNSTWNTLETREMLTARDEKTGEYKIPHVIVFDTFDSETVAYADVVFPDTTYLERYDATSLQDRPISEPDGPADSIRQPAAMPWLESRPTADTLIELANRLKLPGFVDEQGRPKYHTYQDFIQLWETEPGSGVGLLAGYRGVNGDKMLVGEPNPRQLEFYKENKAFWRYRLPDDQRYYRMANQKYLNWAASVKWIGKPEPIVLHLYSEPLQTFRLAGQGLWPGKKPSDPVLKERLVRYFSPVPIWYPPLEDQSSDTEKFPLRILTQRPMTHYHSWGSHNAWLRQLLNENPVYMNPVKARELGLEDGQWVWIESRIGKMTARLRYSDAVEPDTVWTWNAVAKGAGSWALHPDSPEVTRAVLINHIIPDKAADERGRFFNNDPVTGQAGWYDTRVAIYPSELQKVWPEPHVTARDPVARSVALERYAYTTSQPIPVEAHGKGNH